MALELATPQRAVLSLPIAGVGSRALAYLLDLGVMIGGWLVIFFAGSLVGSVLELWASLSSVGQVLLVFGLFFTQWGYWTLSEVLGKGQTLGKRLMGIRVVRQDGSPVGVFESAVRNLLRVVDFMPALYPVGLVTMLIDKQHRRLGDLAAGTVLVRLEKIDLGRYASGTAEAGAGTLAAQDVEVLTDFLLRCDALEPAARTALSQLMVARFLTPLDPAARDQALADPERLKAALRARLPSK